MAQIAKSGDRVAVHYTGKHSDGSIFDSSAGREPLEVELGSGMVIPGFDQGIQGMSIGEKKTVHIPADQAYGLHSPEQTVQIERTQIPPHIELALGLELNMQNQDGQVLQVVVIDLSDTHVTLDANHPLAGKDLTFDIELVAIH